LKQEFHAIISTSSTKVAKAKVAKFHVICSSLENYNIHCCKRGKSFDLGGVTSNLVEETPLLKKKTKE
jgi:hypothetical protein